jgi:hypothetical protein
VLTRLAAASGAIVLGGRSDWRLGRGQKRLIDALLAGWAAAAREVLPEKGREIDTWVMRRRRLMQAEQLRVVVGHRDLLAIWPARAGSRAGTLEAYRAVKPDSADNWARKRASHAATLRRASTT